VDECHVFVGILWKRWGTPTGDTYSSGFEEEFVRAFERRGQTGSPEIWLTFKQVDPALLDDPGDDLRKVLAFRKVQETSKAVLYKEVQDTGDWERQFRTWVNAEVVRTGLEEIRSESRLAMDESSVPSQVGEIVPQEYDAGNIDSELPADIRSLAEGLQNLAHQSTDQYIDAFNAINEMQLARLHLLSSAWLSARFTSDLISSHEANILYRYRDSIHLVLPEPDLWLRTLVADANDLIPGWFWFRELTREELSVFLFELAGRDDVAVSARALAHLSRLGAIPTNESDLQVVRSCLTSIHSHIRGAAAAYVGTVFSEKQLAITLEDPATALALTLSEVARLRTRALMRVDVNAALDVAVDAAVESDAALSADLSQMVTDARTEILQAALSSNAWQIRLAAAEQLRLRGELSETKADALLQDSALRVRAVGLMQLVDSGRPLTATEIRQTLQRSNSTATTFGTSDRDKIDPEPIIRHLFQTYPSDVLVPMVDFGSLDGAIAYGVLADRDFETFGVRVRSDLEDDFAALEREGEARVRTALPGEAADRVIADMAKYRDLMAGVFSASALDVLTRHAEARDAALARKELERVKNIYRDDARLPAIELIALTGDSTDAQLLQTFAQNTYGEIRAKALDVALTLSRGPDGIAHDLLRSKDTGFVQAAIRTLWNYPRQDVFPLLDKLLFDDRDNVRLYAVSYVVHHFSVEEIPGVIERYTAQGQYFYNVVAWLDRALYAPAELGSACRSTLLELISSSD